MLTGEGVGQAVLVLAPEALLVLGAVACLLLGSWTPRRHLRRVTLAASVVVVASGAATVLALLGIPDVAPDPVYGTVSLDPLSGAVRLAVAGSLLVLLRTARREAPDDPRAAEVAVMLLLGGAGAQLLALATDLSVLVLAFLLASIPLYGLLAVSRPAADVPDESADRAPGTGTARSAEATVKTYLLGALTGVLLMLGCTLLAGVSGGTTYELLSAAATDAGVPPVVLVAGLVLVLAGLLFKAGAPPVHPWLPDAVAGCSTTAGAFATTVPKLGAVVAVARVGAAVGGGGEVPVVPVLLGGAAIVAMVWGNVVALTQTDVRRLLAWSTVGQTGFLLAAAAAVAGTASGATDDTVAVQALALFLPAYAAANLTCFVVVLAAPERRSVEQWRGSGRTHPGLVVGLGVGLLALVGTPPAGVLVGKVLTLAATWSVDLRWVAATVAVTTVVSLGYYLRWFATCLAVPRDAPDEPGSDADATDADADSEPGSATVAGDRGPRRLLAATATAAVASGLLAGPLLRLLG